MALVSPGISISINDQSQYVNSNVGSVPLVLLATAQDKTYNGSPASGTSAANAGKLLSFTSQRDLVTQMGTPTFQVSAAGTPVNGSEINEYGLMAAYSALGLSNQLFAIRANIDLNQLKGTSVRPIGNPADQTYWVNTGATTWGINVLNATTSSFSTVTPLLVTSSAYVSNQTVGSTTNVPTPISSYGQVGQYALVFVNTDGSVVKAIRLFYKNSSNTWVEVGSSAWQTSLPTVVGTIANPTITASSTLTINTVTVTSTSTTTVTALATSINSASIPGVTASVTTAGYLQLFVTSAAKSNGSVVDGKMIIQDGTHTPLANAGISASSATSFYCPYLFYGSYAQSPTGGWFTTDTQPRPSGSIWWTTSTIGNGLDVILKQFIASSDTYNTLSTPVYQGVPQAIYYLDPIGGGANIPLGTAFIDYSVNDTTANMLRVLVTTGTGSVSGTGGTTSTFNIGDAFTIQSTAPGQSGFNSTTITLTGTTASSFVSQILAANIPYVTATLNSNSTITLTHTSGGVIVLTNVTNTPLTSAGFVSGQGTNVKYNTILGTAYINNWTDVTSTVEYQSNTPYTAPTSGTYWYYSNPSDLDIMINTGSGWAGYLNGGTDVRGYNLSATDSLGPIVTPNTAPTSNNSGGSLVRGDLWLDSGDLENFPSLYRYNGTTWVAINNADQVSSNGIVFADARWDTNGTTDPISGALPSIVSLLSSNYIDLDAPDYRLYARGTLLFNTRRSGYNVKKFVQNYYNTTNYPNLPTPPVPGAPTAIPAITSAWVSASGLDSTGAMNAGSKAQRALIVDAMQSAIDSNLDILSPTYRFNLIVAPNYPELIPNMLTLNDNRGDTAFVIGDTPLDLIPNTVAITNWVNNTNGNGLPSDASASPYLALYYPAGRTNDLSGNQIVVPASHAVLRTFLYNDQVAYPWFAPAGTNRGLVSNLSDIGYIDSASGSFVHNSVSQGLRDALFTLNINPITQLPNSGLVVFGQLTRSGTSTAQNRVNVVRLENYLRTIFTSISNGYLFEPNDAITRKSIATQIENSLNNILALRGLYDFLVICDSSNNTASTIANNQLYVDVAIEPMKDVEFIYIPIAIYNPGEIAQLNTQSS